MKNLLAIDYGLKHVGIAIALTPLAEPVATVSLTIAIPEILKLIDKHDIKEIIIGFSESTTALLTKDFAKELNDHISIPITFHDETLSSNITRKKMAQAGMKQSRRHNKMDHLVAASILQDYIDHQTNI